MLARSDTYISKSLKLLQSSLLYEPGIPIFHHLTTPSFCYIFGHLLAFQLYIFIMSSVQVDSVEFFQCFEIRNSPETDIESVRIALNENPQNAVGSTRALPELTDASIEDDGMSYLAVNIRQNWQPGRTLKIKFLSGQPELHAKVKQYASRWLVYANLKFSWYASSTHASTLREGEKERRKG